MTMLHHAARAFDPDWTAMILCNAPHLVDQPTYYSKTSNMWLPINCVADVPTPMYDSQKRAHKAVVTMLCNSMATESIRHFTGCVRASGLVALLLLLLLLLSTSYFPFLLTSYLLPTYVLLLLILPLLLQLLLLLLHYYPISILINPYQPLSTFINPYQPSSTLINPYQPLSTPYQP